MQLSRPQTLYLAAALLVGMGTAAAARPLYQAAVHHSAKNPTAAKAEAPHADAAASSTARPFEVRQRELFVKTLTAREGRLIRSQTESVARTTQTISALNRVNTLLSQSPTPVGRLLRQANVLSRRLVLQENYLTKHYHRLVTGLNREAAAIARLEKRAPLDPRIPGILEAYSRQAGQVSALHGKPAGTPVR
jgi:hypothetical protein